MRVRLGQSGVCRMAWYASLFRLFCSHVSGRAEVMIGLRTRRFADGGRRQEHLAARECLGYCVYQSTREGLSQGPRAASGKGESGLAGIYVVLVRNRRRVVGGARRRSFD